MREKEGEKVESISYVPLEEYAESEKITVFLIFYITIWYALCV